MTPPTDPDKRREQLARAGAARAGRDRDLGLVEIWFGLAIVLVTALIVLVLWQTGLVKGDWTGLFLVAAFFAARFVIGRGRRHRVGTAEQALTADTRPPIVYLRPFDVDGADSNTSWSTRVRSSPWDRYLSYEERMGRTLRKVGPFVAVGDPTEELPRLGAARLYAADDDWQTKVDNLLAHAGVVLLQAGASEGLAWEVERVVALDAPERLILSLPLARKRRERYETFRRRFGDVFPHHLPESIGHCQFAYFDRDWTPRLLERGTALPEGEAPRELALRRLAREFKIMWGPRWVRYTAYITAGLLAIRGVMVLTGTPGE